MLTRTARGRDSGFPLVLPFAFEVACAHFKMPLKLDGMRYDFGAA